MNNVTFPIGNLALVDKIDKEYGFFGSVLGGICPRAKTLEASTKLFIYNRLGECIAVSRFKSVYPQELLERVGFKDSPGERTLFRDLERLGAHYAPIMCRYQRLIERKGLVSKEQFTDYSSSYFEGKKAELGALGYSRDHQPGKLQLVFGISTGLNNIPSALTIQKGNVQDKKHFKHLFNIVRRVLEPGSLIIMDCGGNTAANKAMIRRHGFHYLTMKAKKQRAYKKYIRAFNQSAKAEIAANGVAYKCVKVSEDGETQYIFYSAKLAEDQFAKKHRRFERELEKNEGRLKKTKKRKVLDTYLCSEGYINAFGSLQKTVFHANPYITGLEGFFILEGSLDEDPAKVLQLYKDKDKAEKLIRDMKEGAELRPMRHWSTNAVFGYLLVVFLTNCLVNLTLKLASKPIVRNHKLLKKYLKNLTLTVVYTPKYFRFSVLANISGEILSVLGDFILRYEDKSLKLRW